MKFFWLWDVIDMSGICDGKISEGCFVNFYSIIDVYFVMTLKSVVYKFVPVDLPVIFVEFHWVCSVVFSIVIPCVY
jgi:hypothetical protein